MDQAANLRKIADKNPRVVAMPDREGKKQTRTIVITSGKGGVGKTSLSVNLALQLARSGKKVLVFDADLGLANINVILGIIPKYNLYHVMKGQKKLKDIIIDTNEGVHIIAGASGYHQLANLDDEGRQKMIDEFDELEGYDIMIIDTGAGASNAVISFVVPSDDVLVVTTPEPTAITDAYGIIKSIVSQTNEKQVKLLVNRVRSVIEARRVAERVINISGQFLNVKVENYGFIYEDELVGKSIRAQKPFSIAYPKSKAAACVSVLSSKLLNNEVKTDFPAREEGDGIGGFFRKIFSSGLGSGQD